VSIAAGGGLYFSYNEQQLGCAGEQGVGNQRRAQKWRDGKTENGNIDDAWYD
jgi:hypothetical protein